MKMKKLLLTCAAVAGVSAALATSSFAAVVTNNEGYSKDAGTYSVKSDLKSQSGQMTILIIPKEAYNAGTVKDSDIIYIDQTAASSQSDIFQDLGLKGGKDLADGDYYIRIGGENIDEDGIIVEMFTVSSAGDTPEYTLGDVDDDGEPTSLDAAEILCYEAGDDSIFDDLEDDDVKFLAADVDGDGEPTSLDASEILCYEAGDDSIFDSLFD